MFHRFVRRTRAAAFIAALIVVSVAVAGCTLTNTATPVGHARHTVIRSDSARSDPIGAKPARVLENVRYGTADGRPLLLDLCLPHRTVTPTATRWPAIVMVHGGSWAVGDKSEWLGLCRWMAAEGFVAATIDYRLAPAHPFPAGIDDLETAVRWLKDPTQGVRYAIDPRRVGAWGGSAGGNLVSLLGVSGTGSLARGDRVQAVAELSGPINLTQNGLEQRTFYPFELRYLGCASYANCADAVAASPIFHIASTDPPFFVAQSTDERIPLVQSQAFVAALRKAGVPVTFVTRPGDRHSVALLDPRIKDEILAFFKRTLGNPSLATH
jgi:acetyl esterase/lipase